MEPRIEHEPSSGNVYADIGLADAEELQARAEIGSRIMQTLNQKPLFQHEIAALFGITQTKVRHLLNGHFSRFTKKELLRLAAIIKA